METVVQSYDSIHEFLRARLLTIREKNPGYSGRAFAKRLGISPGALSEVLNGSRVVSRKLAERICERLTLDPMERALVLKSFPERRIKTPSSEVEQSLNYLKLSTDEFKLISEWYYFGILALMKTSDFISDVGYVAERLGLSRAQVNQALETLIRLKVISISEDGTWVRSLTGHRTSDGIKNGSIRKSHLETLELAKNSMMNDVFEETDYTSFTFPLDVSDIPRAKEKIRKFQNELYEEFNSAKKPKDVYRMGVQLFPLTRTPNKGKQS